jgi:hypothetical protein
MTVNSIASGLARWARRLVLMGAAVHGVRVGLVEGFEKGLLDAVLVIFFCFVIKRVLFGPRSLMWLDESVLQDHLQHRGWHGTGPYEPGETFEKDWFRR